MDESGDLGESAKTLESAVDQAEQANPGSRAVSVTPKLEKGHALAVVALVKGTARRTVREPLE